jgi:hypothetical protein
MLVHRAPSTAPTRLRDLRRAGRLARTVLAAGAALGLVFAAVPTASAATNPGPYVALGDSYSAGSGILPLSSYTPLCTQTTKNYPHLIAAATGASLTDVTCGGATTGSFYSSQFPGFTAPQLSAVTSSTKLVTLTIGGNDSNVFVGAILACASAGIATLGFGSPCKSIYGSSFTNTIQSTTYPAVKKALQDIHAKAPGARVAILAYPRILPNDNIGCFLTMPIARGDVSYVNGIESTLNSVIKQAAADTGSTYVDTWTPSTGHDACKAIGTRWVEPALFGTNYVPVHPNTLGESFMANTAMATLGLG